MLRVKEQRGPIPRRLQTGSSETPAYCFLRILKGSSVQSKKAFADMEITMSPRISAGNRIILEMLREKYNPDMIIKESCLKELL